MDSRISVTDNRWHRALLAFGGAILLGLFAYGALLENGPWRIPLGALVLAFSICLITPSLRRSTARLLLSLCMAATTYWGAVPLYLGLQAVLPYPPGWIALSLSSAIAGFCWMSLGLLVNGRNPLCAPLLLTCGSAIGWEALQSIQHYRCPISGLFEFLCAVLGGGLGIALFYVGHRRPLLGGTALAIGIASLGIAYTLFWMPPGDDCSLRIEQDEWRTGYVFHGPKAEVAFSHAMLPDYDGKDPVSAMYYSGVFRRQNEFAHLARVTDPEEIAAVFRGLHAQDDKRCKEEIEEGSIPPFMIHLWKLRKPPFRGSIWRASKPKGLHW
ncbi:MAG: hypothetical protein R3F33_07435 [Planctomycetota bacterium]